MNTILVFLSMMTKGECMDNRHYNYVCFYCGDPEENVDWALPGDLLFTILEFSGLVRLGRSSSFFVIYQPRLS